MGWDHDGYYLALSSLLNLSISFEALYELFIFLCHWFYGYWLEKYCSFIYLITCFSFNFLPYLAPPRPVSMFLLVSVSDEF